MTTTREPKTTDYCRVCNQSPESGSHLPHGHRYVAPWEPIPKMVPTKTVRPGRRCSCSPERVVRYAIPSTPGLPRGLVSCRPPGTSKWSDVRHHDLPPTHDAEVWVPGVG